MIDAVPAAGQKAAALQVHQEAVDRADRQFRQRGNSLGGQAAGRLAEQLQETQATLQGGDVVTSFCGR